MMHMLDVVKRVLLQGKDMWDSVTARYSTRDHHWPERDLDSLRRKFKALYGLRKPTGNPNIPGHVRLAKIIKKYIDDASSVYLASDCDEDTEERGEGDIDDHDPITTYTSLSSSAALTPSVTSVNERSDEDLGDLATGTVPPFNMSGDDIPSVDTDFAALEAEFINATKTVYTGHPDPVTDAEAVALGVVLAKAKTKGKRSKGTPSKNDHASGEIEYAETADRRERVRYPHLVDRSDRLGGINLAAMRDKMKKRTYEEFEEASFTKQKRGKADKSTAELKRKLDVATQSTTDGSVELIKTVMMLRADADREDRARLETAEAKRAAERDAREDRRREERREDRAAAEEIRREERQGSRAHMREMIMILSAIQNGKMPTMEM